VVEGEEDEDEVTGSEAGSDLGSVKELSSGGAGRASSGLAPRGAYLDTPDHARRLRLRGSKLARLLGRPIENRATTALRAAVDALRETQESLCEAHEVVSELPQLLAETGQTLRHFAACKAVDRTTTAVAAQA